MMQDGIDRRGVLTAAAVGLTAAVLPAAASASSLTVDVTPPSDPVVVADALVQRANATTNYPSSGLLLKNFSTFHRICYVRFSLVGSDWASADAPALSLTTSSNNNGTAGVTTTFEVEVYGLKESAAGYAWVETGITWDTRPAPGSETGGRHVPNADATLLGTLQVAALTPPAVCTLTTTGLGDFVRGLANPAVTFILIRKDTTNENLAFHDRESTEGLYKPVLTLG